jgi:hypothetical protein
MELYQDRHINFFLYNIMGKKTRRNSTRKNMMRKMYGGLDANGKQTWTEYIYGVDSGNRTWYEWATSLPSTVFSSSENAGNTVVTTVENAGITVKDAAAGVITGVADSVKNAVAGVDGDSSEQQPATQQSTTQPTAEILSFGQGGRRRRRRTKMRGGDFIPNSAFTNAMEVHDIQMASPQTLVGGRRRRRKSSRKIRKSRRSRSSRRH